MQNRQFRLFFDILTSAYCDYHIFLKLKSNRAKILDEYLGIVKEALDAGLTPRCHFEDITRADIDGFCLPFAEKLLQLMQEARTRIKICLCDTLGFGVTYPGAALPRSVPRLVHSFVTELGYPGAPLEWHGHNDFHRVHVNAVTAWLYGCSALNSTVLGFGERTGNPPLEAAMMKYIGLKGTNDGMDPRVITEITSAEPHYSDLFFSKYTGKLIMTAAMPILDAEGCMYAVMDIDFGFEELVKLIGSIPDEILQGG